ncbi:hypothetical protein JG688_00007039 [Phytophthora aleatoria]|uniref:RxLR effector protein n=1 Tax=Phytophthora aleatoria TaxID=2496075 RepID=A0A8J5J6J4_9STRA|nr:hypothetical protein JG688_00007039 [Phytophthora aleatoria]
MLACINSINLKLIRTNRVAKITQYFSSLATSTDTVQAIRAYFILLLALATLPNSSNAATANRQTPQDLIQLIDATNMDLRSGWLLRTEATNNQATGPVDEERAAVSELIKKFRTGESKWITDKTLGTRLKFQASKMNLDMQWRNSSKRYRT